MSFKENKKIKKTKDGRKETGESKEELRYKIDKFGNIRKIFFKDK